MTVKQAALSYALATILNRLISNGIPDKDRNTHAENLDEDCKLIHTIRANQQLFKVVIKREDGENAEITDVQTFLGYLDVDVALTSQLTSFGKCFSIGKNKSVPLCLPLSTGMKLPRAAAVAAACEPTESSKIGGKNILAGQDTNDLEGEIVLPMVHAAISLCVPSHTSQQYLGVDTGTASCKSLPCLLHCVVSTTPIDLSFLTRGVCAF
jgi:hypothetical protein